MSIEELEKSIVEDFELFDEWAEKYQYIIEIGQKLPALDDKYKIAENASDVNIYTHIFKMMNLANK